MPHARPNTVQTASVDEAIVALRARTPMNVCRPESECSGLSVLHLAKRAQSLGRLDSCEVDTLVQGVVRLVDALQEKRGDTP